MAYTADTEQERPGYWQLSGAGILFAALFFAASLTPSLIPREPLMQGALAGFSAALGYVVGTFLLWLWRAMQMPMPSSRAWRNVRYGLFAASVAIVVWASWQGVEWQNAVRAAVDSVPVSTIHPFTVTVVAFIVFAVLWLLGSAFMFVVRRLARLLDLLLPGRLAAFLGVVVGVWVFWSLINGALITRIFAIADAGFAAGELVFNEGQEKPDDPMMTGSDASLITWEDLGNRGRDFVARTPDPEEISRFTGQQAVKPVRVYVGRVSADGPRARAELALEELIRAGGFDREILIITTPVGTGWMDPGSHDAIDFMFNGNTAHVGAQYSYLTSVLSIITNVEYGIDQARELFDVIYGHWSQLPEDNRPELYIHGLSQGSLNSQASLPLFDVLGDPFQGAFWAGSPFVSPMWSRVRQNRNQGSPAWRPIYGNGSLVRTTNQENVLDQTRAPWGPIRLIFLNYGSDPIVNFDIATLWRKPAFLDQPRAPDVSPQMRWYPLITAFQIVLDMTAALAVNPGHGHFYYYEDYIDGWAELTDPPGWSPARSEELKQVFAERPAPW